MNTIALNEQTLRQNREFIEYFVLSRQTHITRCPPGSVELLSAMTMKAQTDWDKIRDYKSLPMFAGTIHRSLIEIISQATAATELAASFSVLAYHKERKSAAPTLTEYESQAVAEYHRLADLLGSVIEVLLRESEASRFETFKSNMTRYGLALHVAELFTTLSRSLDKHAVALKLAATARTKLGETLLAQARDEEQQSAKKHEQIAMRKALQDKRTKNTKNSK